MNVHKALQQIQTQRDREALHPESKVTRKWASPIEGKATKRRKLTLNSKTPCKGLPDRGPLKIDLINRKGGYESLVKRSVSIQVNRFEKLLESRIQEFKNELSK